MRRVWGELKRRNVFRVAAVYLAASWLFAQIVAVLSPAFAWPPMVLRIVVMVLAFGLPLVLVAAWMFEITPEGLKATRHVDREQSIRYVTGRKLERLFVLLFGLVVATLLGERFFVDTPELERGPVEASVAVLPFANLSSDPEQEYFVDGITEEILNSLSRIPDLKVSGRTSSFYFKGQNEDLRSIGEILGVAYLLEGSVRKSGNDLRITAQLNNAATGYHLWSKAYDRPLDDIFAIQEDIARSVAEALQVSLGVGELGHTPGMTRNLDAYDTYLAAEALARESTPASTTEAIELLEKAVRLDPSFGVAWGALAFACDQFMIVSGQESPELLEKVDRALEEMRRIMPDAPSYFLRLAIFANRRGDLLAGDRYLEQARLTARQQGTVIDLDVPRGIFLIIVGRSSEAVAELEHARSRDPLDSLVSMFLAQAYANSGNLEAAMREQDRGALLQGQQALLRPSALVTALAIGDRSLMDTTLQAAIEADPVAPHINRAMQRTLDRPHEAVKELHRLAAGSSTPMELSSIALWAAYFGEAEFALTIMQNDILRSASGSVLILTAWRPVMKDVRKLPGFKSLLRETRLLEYWRSTGQWGEFCRPVGDSDFECR